MMRRSTEWVTFRLWPWHTPENHSWQPLERCTISLAGVDNVVKDNCHHRASATSTHPIITHPSTLPRVLGRNEPSIQ